VLHVEGADLELDVGGLTELTAEKNGPMVVFDKFAGYPAGFRVAANANRTLRRFALAMELPLDIHPLELLRRWRDKRADSKPIAARVVNDGPVLAHVQQGDAVNIENFPAPRWHPGDGGRYIGTQDMVIVRDPEQGWVNMGCYRAMVQRRDRVSLWINPQKHGRILAQKYWRAGKFAADPSQIVRPSWCRGRGGWFINPALRQFPREHFDYLWMIRPPPFDPRHVEGLDPVWRNGRSVLYRIPK
jgi:UbiD family decarboxylase